MEQSRIDLSRYRLEQAEQCIISKVLYKIGDFIEVIDFVKHSGVISYFRKTYIKIGIFDIKLSNTISEVKV